MSSIEEAFNESNGKPTVYQGRQIQLGDCIKVDESNLLVLNFLSVNSSWRQGVHVGSRGTLRINNQEDKNFVLWSDYGICEIPIQIVRKSKYGIWVWNVWQVEGGPMLYGCGGAAMIIEEKDTEKVYHCNDGHADDDFDDLVFKVSGIY
jgi:hypothetical protein